MPRLPYKLLWSCLAVALTVGPALAQSALTPVEQRRIQLERQRLLSQSPAAAEITNRLNQQKLEIYLDSLADLDYANSAEHATRRAGKNAGKTARNIRVDAEKARLASLVGPDRARLERIETRRETANMVRANPTDEELAAFTGDMDRLLSLIDQSRM
jgi:hypothetical protein